jgi:1-acyl-sn-glycerol-3-phosphate acyltransferase
MSSTASSSPSSETEGLYTGPEYREASLRPLDPLVHPDPYRPRLTYRLLFALVRLFVRLLFRFRVEGLQNVPNGPFLIASNHQAWYDTAFIVAAFPRLPMIYTMARRDTVFNTRWKRWLVPKLGVFPIQPRHGELDERGVASVYQVLRRGGAVLIFPEGRYSRGRDLKPLRKGVAHFALQAGVPILPVAISGVDHLRLFGPVEVSIAPPIRPDPPRWWALNRSVLQIVDNVRRAILTAFDVDGHPRRSGRLWGLRRRIGRRLPRQLRRGPPTPPAPPALPAAPG